MICHGSNELGMIKGNNIYMITQEIFDDNCFAMEEPMKENVPLDEPMETNESECQTSHAEQNASQCQECSSSST